MNFTAVKEHTTTLLLKFIKSKGCYSCPLKPLPMVGRKSAIVEPNFPIDLIYTWVDGADPNHRLKKERYLPKDNRLPVASVSDALFRNNDELRYSLRSVEIFLPWVNRIFIVTDNQTPSWLNLAHPKVEIVDHTEIIPHKYLPTFTCRTIESFLHTIPKLSEHFIYCNDDFFFSAPALPSDFFTANGLPYLFTDWRESRKEGYLKANTPHSSSYSNTIQYLEQKDIHPAPRVITAHMPAPQCKQNAHDAFDFFEPAISVFAHNKFRTMLDMAVYCHMFALWSYVFKKAIPCDMPFYYVNIKRKGRKKIYKAILHNKKKKKMPLFYCLNEPAGEDENTQEYQNDYQQFINDFYPNPSAFEL